MQQKIMILIQKLGVKSLELIRDLGAFGFFFYELITTIISGKFPTKLFLEALVNLFIRSLPLIALTAIFTGAVLALQSYTGFSRMNAQSSIPSIVVISLTRELGPVLTGLIFAGRSGAALAAEMGTMKVTDQIDAIEMLGVNSKKSLIAPKFLASMLALPLLVLLADLIGIFGGYLVATNSLGFSPNFYLQKTIKFLQFHDVLSGLIKAFFFGIIVVLIGCYKGYNASKGAAGVGIATTSSVVTSSVMILILNYIITGLMFDK
jgi:phospholipid/cholesterol/gamma-HCH transport system permease protein